MFDDISKKIQKDQTVVLILLDLSAAFDTKKLYRPHYSG